ncbi:MAG: DUF4199 domain-containing protein [Psychroflexus halocasei]
MKITIVELKWGLIFIVTSLLWMYLEKLVGLHSTHIDLHMYLTNLFAIPAILIFVLALKDKKKKDYNDSISFKQAFISGLIITLIITIFSPLTQIITSNIITPEYFQNVIGYSVNSGYYETQQEAKSYFNLENYIYQSVIGSLVMGVLTSLIVSYFIRTKTKLTK